MYLFPRFDRIRIKTNKKTKLCNSKYFEEIENELIKQEDAIIIIGGRFRLY